MVLPSEERKCGDLLSLHAIESSADTGHPSLAIPPADNPWENPGSLEENRPIEILVPLIGLGRSGRPSDGVGMKLGLHAREEEQAMQLRVRRMI